MTEAQTYMLLAVVLVAIGGVIYWRIRGKVKPGGGKRKPPVPPQPK